MANLMRICAEIDLDAVSYNIAQVQQKAGPDVKVMAVIKANGYGHGAIPIARALSQRNHIYGFAVATAEEGAELRRSGITQPILILGHTFPEQFETVLQSHLTQTVFQLETARALSECAVHMGVCCKVHIKIDTGMGRIGLPAAQASIAEIKQIAALPGIEAEGIFTHFACADESDKTSANLQEEKFTSFLALLEQKGVFIPIRHVCNSAAILDFDDRYFDLVRSGIMTYGLYPSEEVKRNGIHLRPAMTLKSHVAFVKTIHAGDSVSYGATYTAADDRIIATVPVGYADGYPRSLSNRGRVLVNGKFAPVVGRVCMDQFMVDVTGIPGVKQGDPVILVGKMGENQISFEELAALAGGFHYEMVCNINRRVPRVYLEGGQVTLVEDGLDEKNDSLFEEEAEWIAHTSKN